jgi:HrpA-like RNA helicase
MLRTYAYYNPEMKLVILSATMDDDEPTYRRYYRDINDNQKSPLDTRLRDLKLDRINIDRRFHISPPGYGTNFPIEEIYRPQSNVYDIVREIIKDGIKGSILIFQPGEADIVKMVEELNKFLPDDVLAIPFYSSLSDDKKQLVGEIDKRHREIRISKTDDFKTIKDPSYGSSTYNHFVICATNIAEASITISKLFYVIETGTRKSNIYDYKNRISKL